MDDMNNTDEPSEVEMNLASLLPAADRLEAMAQSVVARLTARRIRLRDALPQQLLRWAAPSLGLAAALATGLLLVGTKHEALEPTGSAAFTQWALSNEAPATNRILETYSEDGQP